MLLVGFTGTNSKSPGFLSVINNLERGLVGGVLFLPANIARRADLETMVRMIKQCACETTPLIAIDEEGGTVDRLGRQFRFQPISSAAVIGRSTDEAAKRQYAALAKKLADVGFNMNFAPVVDLNKNPRNPVIGAQGRSYSIDAAVVEKYARIFIGEHHALNILTTLKHFPGHGSSVSDTHRMPADVKLSWSQEELVPYRDLIEAGLVDTVMVGHLANNLRWGGVATQQGATAISQLLRTELKFDGVVISDDLMMQAVVRGKSSLADVAKSSVKAGIDLLLVTPSGRPESENTGAYVNAAVVEGVLSGAIGENDIIQSWQRVMSLKVKLQSTQRNLEPDQALHVQSNAKGPALQKGDACPHGYLFPETARAAPLSQVKCINVRTTGGLRGRASFRMHSLRRFHPARAGRRYRLSQQGHPPTRHLRRYL